MEGSGSRSVCLTNGSRSGRLNLNIKILRIRIRNTGCNEDFFDFFVFFEYCWRKKKEKNLREAKFCKNIWQQNITIRIIIFSRKLKRHFSPLLVLMIGFCDLCTNWNLIKFLSSPPLLSRYGASTFSTNIGLARLLNERNISGEFHRDHNWYMGLPPPFTLKRTVCPREKKLNI